VGAGAREDALVRNWFLVFLLGCVVGAIVSLLALTEPEFEAPAPLDDTPAVVSISPVSTLTRSIALSGPSGSMQLIVLDPDSDDEALADALELALFERDWGPVAATARVLKLRGERAARGGGLEEVLSAGSLLALDHEYRRRALLLELRNRDNAATRLLRGDEPAAEVERQLTDLFLAPIIQPSDQVVRRDAALLLARLGGEGSRELLLRAMREEPDPRTSQVAAEALAQAGDPVASELLITTLRDDLDPALRARAAQALGHSRDLVAGGPVATAVARVALDDTDQGVRSHALAALARADLGSSVMARSALIQVATSETELPLLRQAAVAAVRAHHAISKATPPELSQTLEGLLRTHHAGLRLEVIGALEEIGDAETLELLRLELLTARNPAERGALAQAVQTLELRAVPR
jgi:HEAT repeat protein